MTRPNSPAKQERTDKNRRRRMRNAAIIEEYKRAFKCRCGYSDPRGLEFHHRDPTQRFKGVTQMVYEGYSMKRVWEEVAKCDILCANCHKIEHMEWRAVERIERGDDPRAGIGEAAGGL